MAPAIDHLSALPESLITTILSLIPLKDAVKTSVLSHNWHNTWQARTNIEIKDSNFPSTRHCLIFTRQWLTRYPHATIERFALTLSSSPPDLDIHLLLASFVGFALAHETKALELQLVGPSFELPDFVYHYDSLDDLKLYSCSFTVNQFVNLTWLKTASLGRMPLENDALKDLLMGCPLLESLHLFDCKEATEYTVVSPRMKSLFIDSCLDLLNLTVITPNLKKFKYFGALIGFQMIGLGMLEEADVDLGYTPYCDEESGELVQDLLVCFKHASVLRVCSYTTQVLATASNPWNLPRRIGIKHLIIDSAFHRYEFVGIACLLRSCPSLEKIHFDVGPRQIYEDDEYHPCADLKTDTFWGEDFKAPNCIKNKLQEVEVNGFGGSDNEYRFLKFLVEYGRVLKTVRVKIVRADDGAWIQLSQDITTFLNTCRRRNSANVLNIMIE